MIAIPFAVDIEKVKAVFGCKNRELLEKIKTAGLYDNYASQDDDFPDPKYQYDFDQALEDIIFNYVKPEDRKSKSSFLGLVKSKPTSGLNENIAHGYGYVLLVICDYFGTHLLPQCDGFYYGRDFEAAVETMKEKGLQIDFGDMFEQHQIFDIPKIADFPAINLYTKQDIEHFNSIMDKVEIDEDKANDDNDDFDEVQEMLKNIRDSFRTCKDKNVEMITFTH
ncbi:MAG: DUF7691 family protein [Ginsengibacter sp.]